MKPDLHAAIDTTALATAAIVTIIGKDEASCIAVMRAFIELLDEGSQDFDFGVLRLDIRWSDHDVTIVVVTVDTWDVGERLGALFGDARVAVHFVGPFLISYGRCPGLYSRTSGVEPEASRREAIGDLAKEYLVVRKERGESPS